MPSKILKYVRGLLTVSEAATCMALSRVLRCSHDRLTRTLVDRKLEWQTLLTSFARALFGKLNDGFLIIDDTVINKSFAKVIDGIAWVFCSKEGRSVLGLNIVVLAWSNGNVTIPLAVKIWKKGGNSKYQLALGLLSYARNILRVKPKYVTFDSWYASQKILCRLQRYGWTFYTQIKKNRKFCGHQVKRHHRHPYWIEDGTIDDDFQVRLVRHGKKYFITNNLPASKLEILQRYRLRWNIETMFRILYHQLGLEQCQARLLPAQTAHIFLTLFAFMVLESQRLRTAKTHYQLRRLYRFQPKRLDNLFSKPIFQSA
jgi:putative transposase